MVRTGSKRHRSLLQTCRTSPSSKACRKFVYYSKGIKVRRRDGTMVAPRNGRMTRTTLTRNRHGKIVSKRKSRQGARNYYTRPSRIRKWNEDIRLLKHGPPIDGVDGGADEEYAEYESFPEYVPFEPRRSNWSRTVIPPGGLSYHGTTRDALSERVA